MKYPKFNYEVEIPAGTPFWRVWLYVRLATIAGMIADASFKSFVNSGWVKFRKQKIRSLLVFWRL